MKQLAQRSIKIVFIVLVAVASYLGGNYVAQKNVRLANSLDNKSCVWLDNALVENFYGPGASKRTHSKTELVQKASSADIPVAHQSCMYLLNQPNSSGEDAVATDVWLFKSNDQAKAYAQEVVEPLRYWSSGNPDSIDITTNVLTNVVVGDGGKGKAQYVAFYSVVNSVVLEGRVPCSNESIDANDIEKCTEAANKIGQSMRSRAASDSKLNPFVKS